MLVILNSTKVFFLYLLDKLFQQPVQIRVPKKRKETIEETKKVFAHRDTNNVSLSTNCEILPQAVRHDCFKCRYLKHVSSQSQWTCSVSAQGSALQKVCKSRSVRTHNCFFFFFVSGTCRSPFQWSFIQTLLLQLDPIWEADEISQPWLSACFLQDFTIWILSCSPLMMKALDRETMEICFIFQSVILQ